MKTQQSTDWHPPRRWPILPVLLGLDAFVTGGLIALLTVNRLLQEHADRYAPYNMDATSTILDLLDDLLAYLLPCAALLAFLILTTIAVGVWQKARSRAARHILTALVFSMLLAYTAGVGLYIGKAAKTPSVPPTAPTATPAEVVR